MQNQNEVDKTIELEEINSNSSGELSFEDLNASFEGKKSDKFSINEVYSQKINPTKEKNDSSIQTGKSKLNSRFGCCQII